MRKKCVERPVDKARTVSTRKAVDASSAPRPAAAFAGTLVAPKRLHDGGVRLITLSNGSEKNTTTLLKNAKLGGYVDKSISIDDVKHSSRL